MAVSSPDLMKRLVFQDSIATVGLAEGEGGNQAAMAAFLKEEKLHLPVVSLLE